MTKRLRVTLCILLLVAKFTSDDAELREDIRNLYTRLYIWES